MKADAEAVGWVLVEAIDKAGTVGQDEMVDDFVALGSIDLKAADGTPVQPGKQHGHNPVKAGAHIANQAHTKGGKESRINANKNRAAVQPGVLCPKACIDIAFHGIGSRFDDGDEVMTSGPLQLGTSRQDDRV
ncbi:hypothetical protein LTR64_006515 [Lithohypha guttulata]|uniref:uncharacterized protein n=1 Tax=Lithohypha guttulata TaxID=1690604 RepID=UPI002DE133C1|nr:hypothetical protein LTR51_004927 [Lithohypha guttulata]